MKKKISPTSHFFSLSKSTLKTMNQILEKRVGSNSTKNKKRNRADGEKDTKRKTNEF